MVAVPKIPFDKDPIHGNDASIWNLALRDHGSNVQEGIVRMGYGFFL